MSGNSDFDFEHLKNRFRLIQILINKTGVTQLLKKSEPQA